MKYHLACCSSCMWLFSIKQGVIPCPSCGNPFHYKATTVFGKKAYSYAKSQEAWFERAMDNLAVTLHTQIKNPPCCYKHKTTKYLHEDGCPYKASSILILGDSHE